MQKNKNNYNIEPSQNKCSSSQISHTEFEEYLKQFFKKPDENTYDVLNCNEVYVKKRNEDLLYQLLIGDDDIVECSKVDGVNGIVDGVNDTVDGVDGDNGIVDGVNGIVDGVNGIVDGDIKSFNETGDIKSIYETGDIKSINRTGDINTNDKVCKVSEEVDRTSNVNYNTTTTTTTTHNKTSSTTKNPNTTTNPNTYSTTTHYKTSPTTTHNKTSPTTTHNITSPTTTHNITSPTTTHNITSPTTTHNKTSSTTNNSQLTYNLYKSQLKINNQRKKTLTTLIKSKAIYNLEFDLIRDIDTEIENCILRRNKKKRKGDIDIVLSKLVQRREDVLKMFDSCCDKEEEEIDFCDDGNVFDIV